MLLRPLGTALLLFAQAPSATLAVAVPELSSAKQVTLQDGSRNRAIPVLLYGAVEGSPKPLAIVSHGYGGHNTEYSFLASALVHRGYLVASIEHLEQPGDPPMVNTDKLAEARRPVWQVGVDSIQFVITELRHEGLAEKNEPVVVIGHSNGGDMTMLFALEHPKEVAIAFSLDNRRMPLPRTAHPRICSVRSSNYVADPGVLPTTDEQTTLNMLIVPVPVKHEDMWDGADAKQRDAILRVVQACLNGPDGRAR